MDVYGWKLNETKETLESTLDLAKRLKPDTAQVFPIMVYPGTAAYKEAKEKGYLTTEDYSEWLTPDGLHNSALIFLTFHIRACRIL